MVLVTVMMMIMPSISLFPLLCLLSVLRGHYYNYYISLNTAAADQVIRILSISFCNYYFLKS